jgi:hypothetical protein
MYFTQRCCWVTASRQVRWGIGDEAAAVVGRSGEATGAAEIILDQHQALPSGLSTWGSGKKPWATVYLGSHSGQWPVSSSMLSRCSLPSLSLRAGAAMWTGSSGWVRDLLCAPALHLCLRRSSFLYCQRVGRKPQKNGWWPCVKQRVLFTLLLIVVIF